MIDLSLDQGSPLRAEAGLFLKAIVVFSFVACMGWFFFHGPRKYPPFEGIPSAFERYSYWVVGVFAVAYVPLRLVSPRVLWPFPRSSATTRMYVQLSLVASFLAAAEYVCTLGTGQVAP